jgi:DNA gyrase subunit B
MTERPYQVSGGLHGVGVSVVNALSEWVHVDVYRDEKVHHMSFVRGVAQGVLEVEPVPVGTSTGTRVHFKPDPLIFKTTIEVSKFPPSLSPVFSQFLNTDRD